MKSLLPRLRAEFPFIGSRPATETDFYNACERHNITVVLTNDVRTGLYIKTGNNEQFIFLNKHLKGFRLLHVAFHELAHALFHAPSRSVAAEFFDLHWRRRYEREADATAALLLITKKEIADSISDEPHLKEIADLIRLRLDLHNAGLLL